MKTQDGIKLGDILRSVSSVPGITVREGKSHDYVLQYSGLRPCPLDQSTHAERMLAPWLRAVTGLDKRSIYNCLREGAAIA